MSDENESSLTEAEYERWVPLVVAVKRLNGGTTNYTDLTVRAMRLRLREGSLRSASEEAIWRKKDGSVLFNRWATIGPEIWERYPPEESSQIWRIGDGDIGFTQANARGYNVSNEMFDMVTLIGIRLNPDHVHKLAHSMGLVDVDWQQPVPMAPIGTLPQTANRRQDLPLLPDAIASAWADWFKTSLTVTRAAAEKSAAHMFPNHNFSRERIRDLIEPSSQGRRGKSDS